MSRFDIGFTESEIIRRQIGSVAVYEDVFATELIDEDFYVRLDHATLAAWRYLLDNGATVEELLWLYKEVM